MKETSGLSVKHDRSPVIKIRVCPKSEVFCYKTPICSPQKGCKSRYINRVHCSLLLYRFHLRTWGQCKYTFFSQNHMSISTYETYTCTEVQVRQNSITKTRNRQNRHRIWSGSWCSSLWSLICGFHINTKCLNL
jgi:hypothetical protein